MANILLIGNTGKDATLLQLLGQLAVQVQQTGKVNDLDNLVARCDIDLLLFQAFPAETDRNTISLAPPPNLPLLVIDHSDTAVSINAPEHTTVDYLRWPLNRGILQRKISLLLQLRKLLLENDKAQQQLTQQQQTITELQTSLAGQNSILDQISKRDGLTGLFNRRYFNEVIIEIFQNTKNMRGDLSLAVFNIDYFSRINSSCGQDFGDFVLNEFAARITSSSRDHDLCFRLSGEDFAILMPSTSEQNALAMAEQLRTSCEGKMFENRQISRTITISAGIASLQKNSPKTHDELISMADHALFCAKAEGRNRSHSYVPVQSSIAGTTGNISVLQETLTRILNKTKTSTIQSLQLLAQEVTALDKTAMIEQTQGYAELLGNRLGFPDKLIETFKNSAAILSSMRYLMHSELITQRRKLTEEEWAILHDFPYKVHQLIKVFDYFYGERTILLHHGERFDGTGYPEGLQGEEIPVGARIFNLANAFAAMNNKRPYRPKLTDDAVLSELTNNAGKQFDPALVLKLIDVIEEKGILKVTQQELENSRKIIRKSLLQ